MSKNHKELKLVASKMAAAGTIIEYDPTSGVDFEVWRNIAGRLIDGTERIFVNPDGCTKQEILASLIQAACLGEEPESVALDFEQGGRFLQTGEKKYIIQALVGKPIPADFAPLPVGDATVMVQNIFGNWFKLVDARSRRELLLHARAHLAAAREVFLQRDNYYRSQGLGNQMNHDNAKTQTRPAALARLEMEEILNLQLSGEQLLTFFVWWSITGEISVSRQLVNKYSDHKAASIDAVAVLMRSTQKPVLHNEMSPIFEFKGVPLYYLNGVCVPGSIVTKPGNAIDPRIVLTCPNPAIRKEIVAKITIARVLTALGDVIEEIGEYQLWGLSLPDRAIRVLRIEARLAEPGADGLPKAWWEGVLSSCQTIRDALTFRNGSDRLPSFIT